MTTPGLFYLGVVTVALLVIFVSVTVREVHTSPPGTTVVGGLLPVTERLEALEVPPVRSLRILIATDGSPCSDHALQMVAVRPWPAGSEIEVVSVVHTRIPNVPDLLMAIEAAHVEALEAERQRVPARLERARLALGAAHGVTVTTKALEGDPGDEILKEAEGWRADLVVLGSHGYGPVTRRLLGSVSLVVALHASCSVEIVRCRQARV